MKNIKIKANKKAITFKVKKGKTTFSRVTKADRVMDEYEKYNIMIHERRVNK